MSSSKWLLKRELAGKSRKHPTGVFGGTIPTRLCFPINKLIGQTTHSSIFHCVLLGFLRGGKHIVGYTQTMVNEFGGEFASDSSCSYLLTVWEFNLDAPIKKVYECCLFESDVRPLSASLHLSMTETKDQKVLCVHGWQRADLDYPFKPDSRWDHLVTIVTIPLDKEGNFNNNNIQDNNNLLHNANGFCELDMENTWTTTVTITFEARGQYNGDMNMQCVYYEEKSTIMVVANTNCGLQCHHVELNKSKLCVIKETTFDVESYVVRCNLLPKNSILLDYDLQMLSATSDGVLVQLLCLYSNECAPTLMRRGTVCFFNPLSGHVLPVRGIAATPIPPTMNVTAFTHIANAHAVLFRGWITCLPTSEDDICVKLCNETVFSGRSLMYMTHPTLPVAIMGFEGPHYAL